MLKRLMGYVVPRSEPVPAESRLLEDRGYAVLRGVFNPTGLCNPHKIFPTDRACIEIKRPRPRGGG